MKQALIYSLKVWLTAVFLGTRISFLIRILTDNSPGIYTFKDMFISAIYDIPVGLIVCIPSWALFSLASYYVNRSKSKMMDKKLLLTLIGLLLMFLPFFFVFWDEITQSNYWPDMAPVVIGYELVIIVGIWFYKFVPICSNGNDNNLQL